MDKIATDDVLSVLKPLWNAKPETASRLRGRIERVLDAAKAQGFRSGENPARWRGHLDQLLPKRQRLTRGHHAAMNYSDLPAFTGRFAGTDGKPQPGHSNLPSSRPRAPVKCSARAGRNLTLVARVWTVPAARMKAGREHRVPLSQRALTIVKAMYEDREWRFRFCRSKTRQSFVGDDALRCCCDA